jgi:phosphoribosylcarboxyaminoimidazole (NCAIR) mutase
MSRTIDLTQEESKRFEEAGIDPASFLKGVAAHLPGIVPSQPTGVPLDPKTVAGIAYLHEKIARAIVDPDEIQAAEAEMDALQRRLNDNRVAAGETPMFRE